MLSSKSWVIKESGAIIKKTTTYFVTFEGQKRKIDADGEAKIRLSVPWKNEWITMTIAVSDIMDEDFIFGFDLLCEMEANVQMCKTVKCRLMVKRVKNGSSN